MGELFLVVLAGCPGAGKSTLAETVCEVLRDRTGHDALALSTDDVVPIQCADALHGLDVEAVMPYSLAGDRVVFHSPAREHLTLRAIAGLAHVIALMQPHLNRHIVAEILPSGTDLFLQALRTTGVARRLPVVGIELVASAQTCRERNRRRPQRLPEDAIDSLTGQGLSSLFGGDEGQLLLGSASVSTEGALDDARHRVASVLASLLARSPGRRPHESPGLADT